MWRIIYHIIIFTKMNNYGCIGVVHFGAFAVVQ